jgi:hypothetical protein
MDPLSLIPHHIRMAVSDVPIEEEVEKKQIPKHFPRVEIHTGICAIIDISGKVF